MRVLIYTLLLIPITLSPLHPALNPAEDPRPEYGAFLGGNLAMHTASFTQLGNYASCCPEFSNSTQLGLYLGGFYTLPISDAWNVMARLTYTSSPYTSTYAETSFVADLRDTPRVREAVFTHELNATLSTIALEPMIGVRPFGALDVFLGASIGYVTTSSFTQTETLTEPEDYGAYLGADRTWVNHDANIPDANSLRASIITMIRYSIDLDRRGAMFLAPEIGFHLPLTDVAQNVDWSYSELRFGVSLGFRSIPEPEPVDTVLPTPVVPTPPPPAPIAVSTIGLFRKDTNGTVQPLRSITVEEVRVLDYLPVLGHVYFDAGSGDVPSRYIEVGGKAVSPTSTLTPDEASLAVLGIVARRLRETPGATLTLTGSTANTADDTGLPLARRRAESVRDALEQLGVPASSIEIKARQSPLMPTRGAGQNEARLAQEENRRVEISSSVPSILDPLTLTSTLMHHDPDTVIVRASTELPDTTLRRVTVGRERSVLLDERYNGTSMEWSVPTTGLPAVKDILVAQLLTRVQGVDSAAARAEVSIDGMSIERKAKEQIAGEEIERYSLILFAFDNATITPEHERQLERIRAKMRDGAHVRIIGMTDAMGSSAYNLDLSRRRALEVAKALGSDESAIEARGAEQPRFSNERPEGRAYNRTVIIEVKTHR